MAITIGAPAINRTFNYGAEQTWVNKEGAADGSGVIDTVKIWAQVDLANCYVGIFYTTNGNTLKCRSATLLGAVTAGSEQTFGGLTLAVVAGDYIGTRFSAGNIDRINVGFAGVWRSADILNHCVVDDEHIYALQAGHAMSLNGIGTSGWTGKVSGVTDPAKVMGVAAANIAKVKGVA